jgi:hypothetical protein
MPVRVGKPHARSACACANVDQSAEVPKVLVLSNRRTRPRARTAAAAAELAICLPLIVFLLLASLEACSMIFLDHSLTIASYEGVRMAINYDGNNTDTLARVNQIVNNRGVEGATITLNPSDVSTVERGNRITVAVSAPCNSNALLPLWFYEGRTLSCSTTMVKE